MNQGNRYGLEIVTRWRGAGRLRVAGFAVGSMAGAAMVVVGCSNVTQGSATGNAAAAQDFRASVQESIVASSSSSAARESKRQAASIKQAVQASCQTWIDSSNDSVDSVNAYVSAFNENSSNLDALAGPAVDSLTGGASQVSASLSDSLPPDLVSALKGWVDSARSLATVLPTATTAEQVNPAISRLEAAKDAAGGACEAAS